MTNDGYSTENQSVFILVVMVLTRPTELVDPLSVNSLHDNAQRYAV